MNKRDPSFSLYEFKYWLAGQPDFQLPDMTSINAKKVMGDLMGSKVLSRLGATRLNSQIAKYNADLNVDEVKSLAKSFKESGGTVVEMRDLELVIEVDNKQFALPKMYTKASS